MTWGGERRTASKPNVLEGRSRSPRPRLGVSERQQIIRGADGPEASVEVDRAVTHVSAGFDARVAESSRADYEHGTATRLHTGSTPDRPVVQSNAIHTRIGWERSISRVRRPVEYRRARIIGLPAVEVWRCERS